MTVNSYATCQNLARNRLRNRNQSSDRPSSCFYPPRHNLLKSPRQRGGDGRVHARSARRSTDTLRHSFFTVFPSDGVRHGVVRVTQTPSPSASLRPGNLSFLGFNTGPPRAPLPSRVPPTPRASRRISRLTSTPVPPTLEPQRRRARHGRRPPPRLQAKTSRTHDRSLASAAERGQPRQAERRRGRSRARSVPRAVSRARRQGFRSHLNPRVRKVRLATAPPPRGGALAPATRRASQRVVRRRRGFAKQQD